MGNAITDSWTTPPECRGQIVEHSYRYHAGTGRVWERIEDHSEEDADKAIRFFSAKCPAGYECDFQDGRPPKTLRWRKEKDAPGWPDGWEG